MGLRMTVLAALGVGVLAAPCGGFRPSSIINDANLANTVDDVAEVGTDVVKGEKECQKLNVDPAVKEEYALGGALAIHFVQRGGGLLLEKPLASSKAPPPRRPGEALHDYVNTVGKNLAAQSLRPTLEWTFGVFEDKSQFNALSAPGGYVFVSQRVLKEVENEGQLAGVLAHEISHVVLKHAIRQYNESKLSMCRAVIGGKAVGKLAASSSAVVATLTKAINGDGTLDLDNEPGLLEDLTERTVSAFDDGNEPELELEADQMAVQLMMSAGYDPRDYIRLLGKLTDDTSQKNHPSKSDRQANLEKYLSRLKAKPGEFPGLATEGFRSPPLKQSALAVIRQGTGVAKGTP